MKTGKDDGENVVIATQDERRRITRTRKHEDVVTLPLSEIIARVRRNLGITDDAMVEALLGGVRISAMDSTLTLRFTRPDTSVETGDVLA